jgi:autoinducer 2-degrading protein
MHVLIVTWQIKPEFVEAYEEMMKWHIAATRSSEPGCLRFDICRDNNQPRTYHLYEIYADDAAMEAHAKSPTLPTVREKIGVWVEGRSYHQATLLPHLMADA